MHTINMLESINPHNVTQSVRWHYVRASVQFQGIIETHRILIFVSNQRDDGRNKAYHFGGAVRGV